MQTRIHIGGRWQEARDGSKLPVSDPADDSVIAEVPACGEIETLEAIDAAEDAQNGFATLPVRNRVSMLHAISSGLEAHKEQLASLITREGGKPLHESRIEIDYSRSFFDQAARDILQISDEEFSPPDKTVKVRYLPVGMTASIVAWNFPLALLAKKLAPAIATGCTHVTKPADLTPLTTLAFAEILQEVGIPDGVFNVVTGHPEAIGRTLLSDPRIRKLSFTGSTRVGRILIGQSAANITRLSLELGGHAPFLVFDDADLNEAVDMAMAAKFRNTGQTCICPNRFLVHESLHDAFASRLAEKAGALVSGRGTDPDVHLGPLINDAGVRKVMNHIEDAMDHGGTLLSGGGRRTVEGLADRFLEPTVITGLSADMLCWREETFGPMCPIRSFATEEEAIALANDSAYGLASYACTHDEDRILRLGRLLQTGIIGINDPGPAIASVPVGGVGCSGYGREGGRWALDSYLSTVMTSRRD